MRFVHIIYLYYFLLQHGQVRYLWGWLNVIYPHFSCVGKTEHGKTTISFKVNLLSLNLNALDGTSEDILFDLNIGPNDDMSESFRSDNESNEDDNYFDHNIGFNDKMIDYFPSYSERNVGFVDLELNKISINCFFVYSIFLYWYFDLVCV